MATTPKFTVAPDFSRCIKLVGQDFFANSGQTKAITVVSRKGDTALSIAQRQATTPPVSMTILAGDKPPTIIGGYANWDKVKRPLRESVLQYIGKDSMALQLELRFINTSIIGISWTPSDPSDPWSVEAECENLEWMAGATSVNNPSPLVWLTTFNARGQQENLIPKRYQGAYTTGAPWIISSLEWGETVLDAKGNRQRADATVTFWQYVTAPGAQTNVQSLAQAIVNANPKLKLRSVTSKIPTATTVTIPA